MKLDKKDILYIIPAIIFVILFTYVPLIELIRYSFTNWNLLSNNYEYIGLKNYEWFFAGSGSQYLWNSLKVTFIYAIGTVLITVVGGLILALILKKASKVFSFLRPLIFLPRYISLSSAAIIFLWILNTKSGILNQILTQMNLQGQDWLGQGNTALLSIVFLSGWKNIGYGMLIYLSTMATIPKEIYETSKIDGAGKIAQFFNVTLPAISSTILFLTITSFIASMKVFQSIDIMTEGGPFRSTEAFVYLIYRYAIIDFRIGRAATAAVLFFIILAIITLLTYKLSKKLIESNKVW